MQKFSEIIKNRKGFTLIELMIVVAILGILSSLAIASFGDSSSDKAKVGKIKGDLRTLVSAAEMYKLDKSSYPASIDALVTDGYIKKVPTGLEISSTNYTYAWDAASNAAVLCDDDDTDTVLDEGDTIAKVDMDGDGADDDDASSANL